MFIDCWKSYTGSLFKFTCSLCIVLLFNIRWLHETWPLGLRSRIDSNGKFIFSRNILISLHNCKLPRIYKWYLHIEFWKKHIFYRSWIEKSKTGRGKEKRGENAEREKRERGRGIEEEKRSWRKQEEAVGGESKDRRRYLNPWIINDPNVEKKNPDTAKSIILPQMSGSSPRHSKISSTISSNISRPVVTPSPTPWKSTGCW